MDVFEVPATALPLATYQHRSRDEFFFKQALGTLGYPGFAYLRDAVKSNPAELLMEALDSEDLDSRVTEALPPWLPVAYPKMDWAEDTLCKESMTQAERKWPRTHRSPGAEHWNLLTDLTVEQLDRAFI
jgi:hypothetical protein